MFSYFLGHCSQTRIFYKDSHPRMCVPTQKQIFCKYNEKGNDRNDKSPRPQFKDSWPELSLLSLHETEHSNLGSFLLGLISVFKPFAQAVPLECICCVFSGAVQENDG